MRALSRRPRFEIRDGRATFVGGRTPKPGEHIKLPDGRSGFFYPKGTIQFSEVVELRRPVTVIRSRIRLVPPPRPPLPWTEFRIGVRRRQNTVRWEKTFENDTPIAFYRKERFR